MKQQFRITVPAKTFGYGADRIVAPAYDALVELQVDLGALAQTLGAKAARSKGRKSRSGGVTVKFLGAA